MSYSLFGDDFVGPFSDVEFEDHLPSLAIMLGIILVLVTLFEKLIDALRSVLSKYGRLQQLFDKVIKELMVLGLISFSLYVLDFAGLCDWLGKLLNKDPDKIRGVYKFVHMTLFFVGVFYTIVVFYLVFFGRRLIRVWRNSCIGSLSTVDRDFGVYKEKYNGASILFLTCQWTQQRQYRATMRRHRILSLRERFYQYNVVPPEFKFVSYLKECLFQDFLRLFGIDWRMWGVAFIVLLPMKYGGHYQDWVWGASVVGIYLLMVLSKKAEKKLAYAPEFDIDQSVGLASPLLGRGVTAEDLESSSGTRTTGESSHPEYEYGALLPRESPRLLSTDASPQVWHTPASTTEGMIIVDGDAFYDGSSRFNLDPETPANNNNNNTSHTNNTPHHPKVATKARAIQQAIRRNRRSISHSRGIQLSPFTMAVMQGSQWGLH
eukprot:GFYU01032730.1.p1 GENE.GFYU01032730.1~~GFYU01032730.1.p1  ORF type:complete len:433 (-),score=107.70 GFYU01032730.1:342-1640(-)